MTSQSVTVTSDDVTLREFQHHSHRSINNLIKFLKSKKNLGQGYIHYASPGRQSGPGFTRGGRAGWARFYQGRGPDFYTAGDRARFYPQPISYVEDLRHIKK